MGTRPDSGTRLKETVSSEAVCGLVSETHRHRLHEIPVLGGWDFVGGSVTQGNRERE